MTEPGIYRIDHHDGAPAGHALPPERGLLELTDSEWRLHFPHLEQAIACGLLQTDIRVSTVGTRRCLMTLSGRDEPAYTVHLVLRSRARTVRADVDERVAGLDRARLLVAAVEQGQWWRDRRVFDRLGPLKARSITGVRYLDGLPRTARVKSTRMAQVLDVGPRGVSLRGWRTHLTIPWDRIAGIDVSDATSSSGEADGPTRGEDGGPTIEVRLHDGFNVRFALPRWAVADLRSRLDPLAEFVELQPVSGIPSVRPRAE